MADFETQSIHDGVGPLHVNRFRIYFRLPWTFVRNRSPSADEVVVEVAREGMAELSRAFVKLFPQIFNGDSGASLGPSTLADAHRCYRRNSATVTRDDRIWNGSPALKFTVDLGDALTPLQMNWPDIRNDWVGILEEHFTDVSGGFAVTTIRPMFGLLAHIPYNRDHFLAGRRSWILHIADEDGAPVTTISSASLGFLETAAIERFSSWVGEGVQASPRLARTMLKKPMQDAISSFWCTLLENFIVWRQLTPTSPQLSRRWMMSRNVYFNWESDYALEEWDRLSCEPWVREITMLHPSLADQLQ